MRVFAFLNIFNDTYVTFQIVSMALPPSSTTIRPKSGRFGYRAAYSGNGDDFPLNITSRYATQWGAWEGIREFIQNWHDGVLSTFELAGGQPDKTVSFEKVRVTR